MPPSVVRRCGGGFDIRNGGCGPQAPGEMMQKMHVSTLILANKCSRDSDEWQDIGMVVLVYREKSRIYVFFGAPNLNLVQLAEILR